jgi:recombination protein RecR
MNANPLLAELIDAFCCLPGIGKKSAQRISYHLLDKHRSEGILLSKSLEKAMKNIKHCRYCRSYTENNECDICLNVKRDPHTLCVVQTPSDIAAIESSAHFNGKYFVLLGLLSPLDGMGPESIGMPLLKAQIISGQFSEIILALSSTVEGNATAYYIAKMIENTEKKEKKEKITLTRLAQGVPVGGELEYLDQSTLSFSFNHRNLFN